VQVGQDAENRLAGAFLEPAQPGFEQRDIARAQVDLGRAAGAFDDHALVGGAQALTRLKHGLHGTRLVLVVGTGVKIGQRLVVDDPLRATDLAAIDADRRIERHVLRLKRGDADTTAVQHAAPRKKMNANQIFAGIASV